jgi:ParB/RepB/Spo0J family partition protein
MYKNVPLNEIYLDHEFNCRGRFLPIDCVELARSIQEIGLQQPITVRELRAEASPGRVGEADLIAKGYKYKVITGHRRFTACKINKAETVEAKILPADTYDAACEDANLVENIQRADLTIEQEAKALKRYVNRGESAQAIADRLGMSNGWVRTRVMLLDLPDEVQTLAGKGFINQNDIRELHRHRVSDRRVIELAAKLRDARINHQKASVDRLVKNKPVSKKEKKERGPNAVSDLMEQVRSLFCSINRDISIPVHDWVSAEGNSIVTAVLAWSGGFINNDELWDRIEQFGSTFGIRVERPVFAEDEQTVAGIAS